MISRFHRISILRYWVPHLIARERASALPVPVRTRLGLWRRGFLSESAVIYGRPPSQLGDYLTDRDRTVRTRSINGRFSQFLDNKILFETVISSLVSVPVNYGIVLDGRIIPLRSDARLTGVDSLVALCQQEGGLVLKPAAGGGGAGVYLLRPDGSGGLSINEATVDRVELELLLRRCDFSVVCQFVRQAAYAREIYPRTTNTIRALTMIDPDSGVAFLAAAVHRFGNAASFPADNWTQGGLCARVDPATGELGPGVAYPKSGVLRFNDTHPETGARIRGVRIPRWQDVLDRLLEVAQAWSRFLYVGWDIVITDAGFSVLEGNNFTDVNLLQVHGPLLTDQRIRKFYEHHGVI